MTRVLITGVYGQLGAAVARMAQNDGMRVIGHDVDTLDITDSDRVMDEVRTARPALLINCAAFTAVDDCESDETTATEVNGTAVGHLADACNAVGADLLHVSTDYVFRGDGARPYRESDPVQPATAYGRSKLVGERMAERAHHHLIVRTAWLYGHGGNNFVEAIRRQIDGGASELRVVADQVGCPTFCEDLARSLLDLAAARATGLAHAANTGSTTWHGFATEIARLLGATINIQAVATDEFPRPAPRPAYSVLDTSRLARLIGRQLPSWQDALKRYLEPPCES
jgi:dTDP-4-dehydrorhamnose reductase